MKLWVTELMGIPHLERIQYIIGIHSSHNNMLVQTVDTPGSIHHSIVTDRPRLPFVPPLRYLQPCDFVHLHPALLPVGMLDLWCLRTQRSLCPLTAVWSSFWTSGCQYP